MKRVLLFLILLSAPFALQAQKYCYVDTQYILANMPEYSEAQNELNKTSEKWQREIELRYEAIENMNKAYRAERVLLTEDMKREREEEIAQSELEAKELQKKRFGLNSMHAAKRKCLKTSLFFRVFSFIQTFGRQITYS